MFEVRQAITSTELEAAIAIQLKVFSGEQGIPEADCMHGNSEASHVLAFDDGQPVATGRLVLSPDGDAEVARIAVLPSHRKAGIGNDLVRALEDLAARQGARRLELHPHRYLQAFYERLGYTKSGDAVDVVGGHELITMCKTIDMPHGTAGDA